MEKDKDRSSGSYSERYNALREARGRPAERTEQPQTEEEEMVPALEDNGNDSGVLGWGTRTVLDAGAENRSVSGDARLGAEALDEAEQEEVQPEEGFSVPKGMMGEGGGIDSNRALDESAQEEVREGGEPEEGLSVPEGMMGEGGGIDSNRALDEAEQEELGDGGEPEEGLMAPEGVAEGSGIDSKAVGPSSTVGESVSVELLAAGERPAMAEQGGVAMHERGKQMDMNPQFIFRHQQVVLNAACALRKLMAPGEGYVAVAPLSLVLAGVGNRRIEPDVMVLPSDASFTETDVKATPELIVEVVTPKSARDDMGARRDLYQAAGVPEYWLIHLTYDMVQRFVAEEDGEYRLEVFGSADAITPYFCRPGEVRVSELLRGDL